jgi:hypothetical protein
MGMLSPDYFPILRSKSHPCEKRMHFVREKRDKVLAGGSMREKD